MLFEAFFGCGVMVGRSWEVLVMFFLYLVLVGLVGVYTAVQVGLKGVMSCWSCWGLHCCAGRAQGCDAREFMQRFNVVCVCKEEFRTGCIVFRQGTKCGSWTDRDRRGLSERKKDHGIKE